MQSVKTEEKTWLIIDLINWAESYFKEKGLENPRGEIEWLLRAVLNCSRMDVYLRFEEPLSSEQLSTLRSFVKRRLKHEPLQYITGFCSFYGREYLVNEHVFIPRSETERLVDLALEKMKNIHAPSVVDVGTGSGCIAITLGLEIQNSNVRGIDISRDALTTAKSNAEYLNTENVCFQEMDFLNETKFEPVDLVISNPPYVTEYEYSSLMQEVRDFEPSVALTDGGNGLTFYQRFAELGRSIVKPSGWMILEVGLGEHPKKVESIFKDHGYYSMAIIKDYNGADRVMVIQNHS